MENSTHETKFEQQFESILHLTRDGHKKQRFMNKSITGKGQLKPFLLQMSLFAKL